jgi:6,7-dimethyl-8-ribityllumazine synthase
MSEFFDRDRLTEVEVPAVPLPERRREEPPEPPEEAPAVEAAEVAEAAEAPEAAEAVEQHAGGDFHVPEGYSVLEGAIRAERRSVAVVVSRFNAEITGRMLELALAELEKAGVQRPSVTVMPVPGAFELPLGAMALAKTRRYACVVALGCVIRGETAHFEYVASEAASGLLLAAIETGVPVAFGVLTTETREQAVARVGRAADAVRSALEMADLFGKLRTRAVSPAA